MKSMMGRYENVQLEVGDKTLSETARRPPGTLKTDCPTQGTTPLRCARSSKLRPLKRKIFKEAGCVTAAAASNKGKQIKLI